MDPLVSVRYLGEQINPKITMENTLKIKSDFSNWVIPGKLACGPYPGFDGINFKTVEEARNNLKSLIDDGINTFVCLQSEYSENPQPHRHFPEFEDYKKTLANEKNISYYHFPVVDGDCPPSKPIFAQQIRTLCDIINNGAVIYIHCAGGHGRTGIFVSCLLAAIFKHFNPEYIMSYVQKMHDLRRIQDRRTASNAIIVLSPNSNKQREFVREFIIYLKFL